MDLRRLAHGKAAIDRKHRTGDEPGVLRSEIFDRRGDLLWRSEAAEGHHIQHCGSLSIAQRREHVGVYRAGGYDIHRDVAPGELLGERTGQTGDSRFRGCIVCLPSLSSEADDR